VICISSDSGDDDAIKKSAESDSSDDVICTGEVVEENPGMQEVNNRLEDFPERCTRPMYVLLQ